MAKESKMKDLKLQVFQCSKHLESFKHSSVQDTLEASSIPVFKTPWRLQAFQWSKHLGSFKHSSVQNTLEASSSLSLS
jgi:hypothetical protein